MKIVYEHGVDEIIEKKSRFIANVFPIKTEEEALAYLEQIRKKHYDARHNCFAYVIGENHECKRSSDDGEPSGTAGHPMLEVILGEEVHDVLVVVTRYFGGTLLGTGGLVRAYSAATKAGLAATTLIDRKKGQKISIETDYNGIGKLQYIMNQCDVTELEAEYGEAVKVIALVPEGECENFKREVIEASSGRAAMEELEPLYYANMKGKIETWTCWII